MRIDYKYMMFCLFLIVLLVPAGCSISARDLSEQPGIAPAIPGNLVTNPPGSIPDNPNETETQNGLQQADLAGIKANESGKVMILMYHVIGAPAEKPWMQTTENFRRDLHLLYEQGYSLISLNDFIQNNITTPAGRSPVVLTFDDASPGHFRYIVGEDGKKEIDPQCAVAILLEFGKEHPDFGHTAIFYINDRPFGQSGYWQEKLRELVSLGFDIGNHTLTHPKMNSLSHEDVQKELANLARLVEDTVPGYRVNSLALPFGIFPTDFNLAVQGIHNEFEYKHEAVLRVGANPAKSPNTAGFDPCRLPRVQASTEELGKWLEYFKKNPQERYISDGDPMTIAVPRDKEEMVDRESIKDKKLVIWPQEQS